MKRNFLLMLLLTLLPLVSWAAEPLSVAKLSVRNVPYGTEALNASVQTNEEDGDFRSSWDRDLVLGVDFTWDGKYYSNQACTTEVTDLATAPVGYYYVKFTGEGFFEGTVVCPFQIQKAKLYVSVKGDIIEREVSEQVVGYTATSLSTTYGVPFDLDDIEGDIVDVKGLQNDEDLDDVVEGEITAVTTEETDANAHPVNTDDGYIPFYVEAVGEQVGGYVDPYAVTLVGLTSQNYEIICVNGMYIKQKDISEEGLTFELPVKFATYNGQVQEPEYKITYGNAVLVQGEDFTVSYPDYAEVLGFEGPKNVLMNNNEVVAYRTLITGQGNYTGTYPGEEGYGEDPFLWTIEPVGLTIITLDQTKVYDGTAALPSTERDEAYEVLLPYGVVIADEEIEEAIGSITISVEGSSPDVKWDGNNVVGRTVKATVTADPNKNYDYNIQNAGKFTITPRGLTITADDKSKKVTEDNDPTLTITMPTINSGTVESTGGFEFEITEDEEEMNADDLNALLVRLCGDTGSGSFGFTRSANSGSDRGAGLNVERKNKTTDVNVGEYNTLEVKYTNQGKIKNYTVTTVNGTFTITGGKIYITALAQSKNYGEPDPDWTPVMGVNYRLDVENQPGKTNAVTLPTEPTLTRVEGETPGTYIISASGAVAPAGYEKIVYANGPFTINPRPITITLANQTFKDGDKVTSLDQTAFTIDNEDATEGLAPNDKASDLFTLAFIRGRDAIEPQDEVEAQNAICKFASWSSGDINDDAAWQYGHGIVEVKEYDEFLEATKVTVIRNIADGATTGAQAAAFNGKTFYVGVEATYTEDGEVQIPLGARQELLSSLDADEAKTGIFVEIEEGAEEGTYTFTSYSAPTEGEQWGEGVVELEAYDETSGLAKLTVTENNAPSGASQQAQTDAQAFVGRTFFVAANPDEEIPQDRLQLLSQNTGIYIAVGETVRPRVEYQEAIPGQDGVEGIVTDENPNPKKEKIVLPDTEEGYAEYEPGITAVFNEDMLGNYDVTLNEGTVWVIPADALVLDTRDTELAQKIEEADGDDKFVAFANRTLRAGQWNVLVLPFDTSVEELSNMFGYAVVDMLDESNANTSTVKLALSFDDIPANTPFLVQPREDVVLSDGIFFTKEIAYSENPEAVDEAGHHYVGTYTGHNVTSEDKSEYYYSISAKAFVNSTSSTRIGSTGAYLKDDNAGTPNEVRYISIQDPDGEENVTAIGEIAADAASKADANADGWYNVQGMKLNAAPTQRGIYIKDGKKVLVK